MIPQYAKSVDPAVISAILANDNQRQSAINRMLEWASERGNDGCCTWKWGQRIHVIGLYSAPKGRGQWTARDSHGVTRPFKSNPEYAEMAALSFAPTPVPGAVVEAVGHTDRNGRSHFLVASPFVSDGVAYLGFSMPPDAPNEQLGPQWVECLGSEWLAAIEAVR